MSKLNLRKITVDPTKCNIDTRRPSVFERLGTKPAVTNTVAAQNTSDYCRNWALNGSCSYGKTCKYANTHTLISPSKRVKKDNVPANALLLVEDPFKRLTSKIVKKASHSPDLNLEEWNQTDLEYEDEKVLERRRQLLQRELEIQMKKDKEVHGKEKTKYKKKAMSSSSSSHTSSSTSSSSSSSSEDSSSSSTSDSRKKVKKFKKVKHHGAGSPDYDDDKERKKKIKLKRLGAKSEKLLPPKKKHKPEVITKKDIPVSATPTKPVKKVTTTPPIRKHAPTVRTKSPAPPTSSHSSSTMKPKERPRSSESPKVSKTNESEKDRHRQPKSIPREPEKAPKDVPKKVVDKKAEFEKSNKCRTDDKSKNDDRSKQRSRERDRRSRTPPISDRSKHQYSVKDQRNKSKRSPTPEKTRSKHDLPSSRHQEKAPTSVSRSSREVEKKDRDTHEKRDRSKDRKDSKPVSSQNDSHRKNSSRDVDDKNYSSDRSRQRSRERRDKDHNSRDDRSHSTHSSRVGRSDQQQRDSVRDKDRDDAPDRRDRQRDRDRDRDSTKTRDREVSSSMLVSSSSMNSLDKSMRYARDKDRSKECTGIVSKSSSRDRRNDRDKDRSDVAKVTSDRDRGSQRFDNRYDSRPALVDKEIAIHKSVDRDRSERFPRDRALLDRVIDKTPSRDHHLVDRDPLYDRDRHRRYNARLDRGHQTNLPHSDNRKSEQSHLPPLKIDRLLERRDSPRRGTEERNYDRGGYPRLSHSEHWEEPEESSGHIEYHRDHHTHDDDRNRKPVESRRYNSPFNERRGRGGTDDRSQSRYTVPQERQFDDHHHSILYSGDKLRTGGAIRDEGSNENWEVHHDLEHGSRDGRDRAYPPPPPNEWEDREWRGRPVWDRESLPRSDAHEEEWAGRYDSPMSNTEWKSGEPRKWDNQSGLHVRSVYGRNDRIKELEITDAAHCKRRPYNTPERREDLPVHGPKPNSLHGAMKEEPINKKLMELAEGKPRKSRERSTDNFQKKPLQKEKPEREAPKEPPPVLEPKRPCLEESLLLPTLHTESDLSDISDDPDDILNMEEEIAEANNSLPKKPESTDRDSLSVKSQDASLSSPKPQPVDAVFGKEKENAETGSYSNKNNIEEETMETMDFEEISDGELEEDIKTSCKGLGDALGVDWESLVKESQPRRPLAATGQENVQERWKCKAVFQRIGISVKAAGEDFIENLLKKYSEDGSEKLLLDNVALVHTALIRRRLSHNTSYELFTNDESNTCRHQDSSDDADDEDEANYEKYKPCTNLYQEAKLLLQET